MTLRDYIEKHYGGSPSALAHALGVQRQQVQQWLDKGFIVVNGALYSKRRDLPDVR